MRGRRVLLGVTGGVAAFKAAYLCRRLLERGAEVEVVLTPSATAFIGAQTFASLTGRHPVTTLFDSERVSPHTELGRWAELIVVAPCTTNTLAKLANGISGDALSATVAASDAPLYVAPAMHTEMWEAAATQDNVLRLRERGVVILGPAEGDLAGGDTGAGRMVEPDEIVDALMGAFGGPLSGRRVVVSAGGTRESIDPVRYIGNRSSGKMGHAIAASALALGASVTLVTSAPNPPRGVEVIEVETAAEMASAVWSACDGADVAVLAAAVADYRPVDPSESKLRRADGPPRVELEPTEDILSGVAAMDGRPFLVGFAAEVGSLDGAVAKATSKGVDLVVGNDVAEPDSGFGTDTNRVAFINPDGTTDQLPLLSKQDGADRLWERIAADLG
ncbi:MAG: bifunctional phosphopantothenoylcysteine decarboxylase/phosphopantothenate--cysteine ligase CoaBC [Acidimicrobiia bacterium]|nr:bifunctional phosphopantothenoylcysteine decarboxylase/phosphopantothenate--cysteine ligase CoaBC [Acidimicrobiia bacterium]